MVHDVRMYCTRYFWIRENDRKVSDDFTILSHAGRKLRTDIPRNTVPNMGFSSASGALMDKTLYIVE